MQAFFDNMQQILADMIDPSTNNVGHFVKHFATGGLADTNENSDLNLIRTLTNAAQKSTIGADATASGGKYGDSPLGQGYYNSAPYIASHYVGLGKFFSGADPGSKYTDRYEQPQKNPSPQSEDPTKFYANWANRMRQFAEAEAIADKGQTTVRTR